MRRAHLALIALGIVGAAGLAGCGKFQKPQRAAWRDQAEAACMASRQVQISSYVSLRGKAIDGPGTCGMQQPLKVSAFSNGGIGLTSSATLSCPVVATTDKWLAEVVQPAAMNVLGAQVIEMRAGSYSCRAMNNGTGTSRTSEHAFGNAVDIFSFRLNDNRVITVKDGWRGSPEEQNFLREVFVGACEHFSTVLGPGADPFHYDHFHIDLARHSKGRHICKPVIKYTPNYNLQPPDPARSYSSAQTLPRGVAPAGTMVAGGGLMRQPSEGLRPPGAVQGGYPVASYGRGQPQGLDAQQRFLEQYDARQKQGRYQPQPLPSENRGPLALPGAVEPSEEEAAFGDGGGSGVMDQQDSEEALPINPRNDPFAYSSGRTPPRR
ncbi:type II secretory pathway pseudopilin PulG [Bosea sp. BE271]|nr:MULTISPECIES: extensin family protein [Bosea]MCR4524276.1 extensin family protein [Bosea sp. 47.2.35]MDR6826374.1 type II secretory pathway pseudopilin PulG [Bosea robiniae]MDR6893084.1 type II secretory pathway pseudopilin PulG [Bosea sp. BE109]MDR7137218.1 type II secretory pathway pseudopilin PulG [Bosea sp. BE168]MDR7173918.1 type II secretory pathway pseudopilin PulG [Bosea sp. BE271]